MIFESDDPDVSFVPDRSDEIRDLRPGAFCPDCATRLEIHCFYRSCSWLRCSNDLCKSLFDTKTGRDGLASQA